MVMQNRCSFSVNIQAHIRRGRTFVLIISSEPVPCVHSSELTASLLYPQLKVWYPDLQVMCMVWYLSVLQGMSPSFL